MNDNLLNVGSGQAFFDKENKDLIEHINDRNAALLKYIIEH
ncbi:hypothetical protein JC2156_00200 [Weissella koreensis KCTC 3621]|nr:hypothetical protein JC2156_00200 [Weissella koreensis KCTC 3621]